MYICKYKNLANLFAMTSKNHTISKIVAKTVLRLLILILAFSIYLYFSKNNNLNNSVYFTNAWALIFPIVLFIIVVILMILMLKKKYVHSDINWLFVLSTLFFIVYLILLYSRIYPII